MVIETSRYRVTGNVSVPTDERLSDYVNESGRDFFAVTEARIAPIEAPDHERGVGFLLVARHEIGVLLLAEDCNIVHDPDRQAAAAEMWAFMQA